MGMVPSEDEQRVIAEAIAASTDGYRLRIEQLEIQIERITHERDVSLTAAKCARQAGYSDGVEAAICKVVGLALEYQDTGILGVLEELLRTYIHHGEK